MHAHPAGGLIAPVLCQVLDAVDDEIRSPSHILGWVEVVEVDADFSILREDALRRIRSCQDHTQRAKPNPRRKSKGNRAKALRGFLPVDTGKKWPHVREHPRALGSVALA